MAVHELLLAGFVVLFPAATENEPQTTAAELETSLAAKWVGADAAEVMKHFGVPTKDKRGRGRRKLVYEFRESAGVVSSPTETIGLSGIMTPRDSGRSGERSGALMEIPGVRGARTRDIATILFRVDAGGRVESVEVKLRKRKHRRE